MRFVFALLALPALFALPPSGAASPPVRFAVLADQTGGAMPGVYDSVLAEVARYEPDFVVTVGDQIEGYAGADTARVRAQLDGLFAQYERAFGAKAHDPGFLVLCAGNHDITDDRAEPLWREKVARPMRRVDTHGVTILLLDTTRRTEEQGLGEEALRFLEAELSEIPKEAPVLVVTHKPYFSAGVWSGAPDPAHALFVEHGVDAVFAGHWHEYVYEPRDGVAYVVCGSSGADNEARPLDEGGFIGFLAGSVDDGVVTLSPTHAGRQYPLDLFNWVESRARRGFTTHGLAMTPFAIEKRHAKVTVTAFNPGDEKAADSLRWRVPAGWTVSPRSAPFDAAPGDSTVAAFDVTFGGRAFPLPSVAAGLRYGRGKSVETALPLSLARTAHAPKVAGMQVDGALSEDEWIDSPPETLFMSPSGGPAAADPCTFRFAHDDRGIYMSARCVVSPGRPIAAALAARDAPVQNEDCVGWFLSSADSLLYQFYVNPKGALLDGRGVCPRGGEARMDYMWNAGCRVACAREAAAWTVELFVPYDALEVNGRKPALRVNMRRKQAAGSVTADWLPVSFRPGDLGRLALER